MSYDDNKTFWPAYVGDNHCPICGNELIITQEYPMSSTRRLYKVRCFECREGYLINSDVTVSMQVKLHRLDDVPQPEHKTS